MTKRIKGSRITDTDIDYSGFPIEPKKSYVYIGNTPICRIPQYIPSVYYRNLKKAERSQIRESKYLLAHPERNAFAFLYD